MEPVLPASSVNSSQQPSRNSPTSDKDHKSSDSQKEEVTDLALDAGFTIEDTDSEDSDVEQGTARTAQKNGDFSSPTKDVEPFVDEEIIKAELGGDPSLNEAKETTAEETDTKEHPSNEDDSKETEKPKKKQRKLKRVTETRKAYDGRELVFVTECTQTDWKWKESTERTGKGTLLAPTSVKPESRQTVSQARTDDESLMDDRTGTDYTPFSLQPNDEFGIPMLDMSSDSDSSDNESPKKTKPQRHHLPTIGPPQILKYIRESDQLERDEGRASSDAEDDHKYLDSAEYVLDENGRPAGMFSGPCEFCGDDIKLFPTLEQQLSEPPESLYCCEDYREFVEFAMSTASRLEEDMSKKNEKISIKVHGHHGSKQARKLAKEQAVQRMRERELARRQQEASGLQAAFYQSKYEDVARQMKTINYQLSSQRCLEEGWTLRAPSPLDLDNPENEVFVPEPLHPAMIASGKLHGRKLVEKFYPDGTKFITMFPDGTGNVFYPSGRLGILISSISLGKNTYVIHDDNDDATILAVFEPNGNGCCYFANGKVRLCYDQLAGTELDINGARKRVWSWRDQETHVHAPPFQPIVFGMNRYLGVRFMSQESIALTLTGRRRSCRFNVGAKLKLVAPELIQPKGVDEDFLFISERKVRVETILNKVTNLLKFPKSPKVDRILPPLSVSAQQQRVDKMAQDYVASLPALGPPVGAGAYGLVSAGVRSSRQPKRSTRQQSRLSPQELPSVSVN